MTRINPTTHKTRFAADIGFVERANERGLLLLGNKSSERRANVRFPLILELRYVVLGRRASLEMGSGRIIDLSSAGLSFTADRPLLTGQKLDVFIDWPVLLDGGVQLQLAISGRVVRSDGTVTALRIDRHEFKTRRSGQKATPLQEVSR